MNFVMSADGSATLDGRSGSLGNRTDRELMHALRAMADVIVIGAGTVRVEGYGGVGVDAEAVAWRRERTLAEQPRLAVVSRALRLAPGDSVFTAAEVPPVVVTCAEAPASRREALADVAEVVVCGEHTVDLAAMLATFADRGWTQVLCEGGPHLFGSLLDAGLVDEVCLTLAPRFAGGDAGRIVQDASERDRRFSLVHALTDDEGFVFLRYAAG
ncbi:pyrimidine reductase family protein [Microbacterium flavescens]|uniref:pyrimidine reductase family protein n=1 Tax=Microbacterium flavescens TaxID=69366 RepID=UPI001BDF1257|nr:pyrimidine reductase family protein [Microbacterium flavescens]